MDHLQIQVRSIRADDVPAARPLLTHLRTSYSATMAMVLPVFIERENLFAERGKNANATVRCIWIKAEANDASATINDQRLISMSSAADPAIVTVDRVRPHRRRCRPRRAGQASHSQSGEA
jgi:hypothetical protein